MAKTYAPIQTTTLGTSAATVTFSSIPPTYTDLVLILQEIAGSGTSWLQFNSDTGANYSQTALYGTGSVAASNRSTNNTFGYAGQSSSSSSQPLTTVVNIMNYSNSTTYKSWLARGNNASVAVVLRAGLWRNTSAITSITVGQDTTSYLAGSTFTLYGIKAA